MIKVSSYQIMEQDILSSGKMGSLYRAIKPPPPSDGFPHSYPNLPADESVFVIKRVDPKYLPHCLTEKSVLSTLIGHYDQFNEIVDAFSTPNHVYLVYKNYIKTLEDFMRSDSKPGFDVVLDYMAQLISAFKVLKLNSIIHRDVRPNNILITNDGLKITGFYSAITENSLENAPFLLASPLYMSPEMLGSQKLTIKSDIWSLGLIFYELLFGKHPFLEIHNDKTDRQQILKAIEYRLQVLETSPHLIFPTFDEYQVSDELKTLIAKMLKATPETRISIEELSQHPLLQRKANIIPQVPLVKYATTECDTSPKPMKKELLLNHQEPTLKAADSPNFRNSLNDSGFKQKTIQVCPDLKTSQIKGHKTSIELFPVAQVNNLDKTRVLDAAHITISRFQDIEDLIFTLQLRYIPYKAIEKIGFINKGGYGHVFKAVYNKQEYALKEIPTVRFEYIYKVLREAANLRKLENPRLVKIYGVSYRPAEFPENSADLFMITELMAGDLQNLIDKKDIYKDNELTYAQKLNIAYQIAQGVYHLHMAPTPLVHADLKPSNILLDESLKVCITDLGISKEMKELDSTYSGGYTAGYAAPEQVLYDVAHYHITIRADIWSLGLVYYFMFFKAKIDNSFVFMNQLFKPGAVFIPPVALDELQGIRNLISKMVRYEAKERLSAEEVLKNLESISQESGVEFKSLMALKQNQNKHG